MFCRYTNKSIELTHSLQFSSYPTEGNLQQNATQIYRAMLRAGGSLSFNGVVVPIDFAATSVCLSLFNRTECISKSGNVYNIKGICCQKRQLFSVCKQYMLQPQLFSVYEWWNLQISKWRKPGLRVSHFR